MEKLKPKISKKVKKVLSSVLAATLVLGSVPASTFLGDAIQVRAAASYSPQKYGVGVLCRDLTTGDKAKEIFNALVRCKSKKEDSLYGSIYNNVGMVKYKYSKTKAGSGETFSVKVQKDYPVLYNQSGQISQNLMAYITNDKHKNFGHHWGNRTQYGKIIFGYPTNANNNSFWLGQSYNTGDHNSDGSWTVGDRDTWAAFRPSLGENKRAALYVTTKKGCGSCGSAKIQNVSIAFKDETAPKIKRITITIDDVGIGVLFGLELYRYEFAGLLMHAEHLEAVHGVGPHTISVPRIRRADDIDPETFDNGIDDDTFAKIVACIRISVPYTGMIVSTRESQACRERVLHLGVSQISGGSRTSVGGYVEPEAEDDNSAQFDVSDNRSLDEVVNWLMHLGYIPSFCTACYREGRTGDRFMSLCKSGQIQNCCHPNALMTLKEYLMDYASEDTRKIGLKLIEKEIPNVPREKTREILEYHLKEIEDGQRDFRF